MITKVKIQNYKSIKSAEIDLNERFNVVFGRNAAGKSNFISSFQLLKKLVDNNDLESIINNKIAPLSGEFFYWKENNTRASFEYTFNSATAAYVFGFEVMFSRNQGHFSIHSECLRKVIGGKETRIYRREQNSSFSGPDDTPIPFKTDPRRLMLTSYSDMTNDTVDAIQVLKNFTFVDTVIEGKEGLMLVPGNKPNIDAIDGLAVSLFIKNGGRFQKASETIRKIIPYFEEPTIQSLDERGGLPKDLAQEGEIKRYLVTWNEKNIEMAYSHHSLSHGDKRVISLIYNLFNADEGSVLAVEEIENGMHYGRIERLLDEFKTQANNRNIQILLTTHNHTILKEIRVMEAIHCTKSPTEGTKFVTLKKADEYEQIEQDLGREPTAAEMISSGLYD